jgi:hypothetical protein
MLVLLHPPHAYQDLLKRCLYGRLKAVAANDTDEDRQLTQAPARMPTGVASKKRQGPSARYAVCFARPPQVLNMYHACRRPKTRPMLILTDDQNQEFSDLIRASLDQSDPRHTAHPTAWFPSVMKLQLVSEARERVPTSKYQDLYMLNDNLVNAYFDLLPSGYSPRGLKLHCVSSLTMHPSGQAGLLRGIRKTGGIQKYDMVLIPLHDEESKQWCLGVLNIRIQSIFVLDPLHVSMQASSYLKHLQYTNMVITNDLACNAQIPYYQTQFSKVLRNVFVTQLVSMSMYLACEFFFTAG